MDFFRQSQWAESHPRRDALEGRKLADVPSERRPLGRTTAGGHREEQEPAGSGMARHLPASKSVRIPLMAATAIPIDTLPSVNPATGEVHAHFERTPASLLPEIVSRARLAQRDWAKFPIRDRCAKLRVLRERIMASRNELVDAVVCESGKPRVEALFADIFVALDSAEYWSKNAESALRTRRVPHHST